MEALHVIETHAAGDESAGSVWGLRYELFWLCLGGGAVSLLIVAALLVSGAVTLVATALAGMPALLSIGFALFRQTHPPGYDADLLDLWLHGPGFGPERPRHPMP